MEILIMSEAYLSRGVSAEKTDVHNAVKTLDKGVFKGAFCTLMPDPTGDSEYCSAMHADGAGTKSSLAYIKFKETGDYTAFFDIAQDSMVMNLDDLLCVGATEGFIMSNTIGRNAHRVDGKAIASVIKGYSAFVEKMRKYGVDITMCGGETADVGDLVQTLIVDSTFFVRMKKTDVVNCDNIKAGDVIVGFASSGQAVYEDKYNAGMGSNGLTAARHLLLAHEYAEKYPETYSNTIPDSQVYCGTYKFNDILPGTNVTVGDAILSPTRTYAPIVKEILEAKREAVHGMVHCTGGGQVKCKNFGIGLHYIKDNLFDVPPLFKAIGENSDVGTAEMYRIFNMGHRLEMFCSPEDAQFMIDVAEKYGVEAKIVGRVEASDTGANKVTIRHNGEEFNY